MLDQFTWTKLLRVDLKRGTYCTENQFRFFGGRIPLVPPSSLFSSTLLDVHQIKECPSERGRSAAKRRPSRRSRKSSIHYRTTIDSGQGDQMAKFDPFPLRLAPHTPPTRCNTRRGRDHILQRSIMEPQSFKPEGPNNYTLKI